MVSFSRLCVTVAVVLLDLYCPFVQVYGYNCKNICCGGVGGVGGVGGGQSSPLWISHTTKIYGRKNDERKLSYLYDNIDWDYGRDQDREQDRGKEHGKESEWIDGAFGATGYTAKTVNQRKYVQSIRNMKIPLVVAVGPAGSGKTMLACMEAISMLKSGKIKKIILTRPLIPVEDEEIGFLPGTMNSKMDPWTRPMFDIFREVYSTNELNLMVKNGVLEIAPLAFMRGRTFHHAFVLADEMQNSSPGQMLMLTTRLGQKSKMIITGDLKQSDRSLNMPHELNGLSDFLQNFYLMPPRSTHESLISVIQMNHTDILRSPFVSYVLQLYSGGSAPRTPPVP